MVEGWREGKETEGQKNREKIVIYPLFLSPPFNVDDRERGKRRRRKRRDKKTKKKQNKKTCTKFRILFFEGEINVLKARGKLGVK